MNKKISLVILAVTLVGTAICRAADSSVEQALRDLDAKWSAAIGAKDLDTAMSYYAAGAIVLPPNKAVATTKEAIRAAWKEDIDTMVSGGWKATKVEVAKSGDTAWISGTYDWVAKDPSGKSVTDKGKYLEVWAKQADGSWKCTADCWNSDLPAEPAPKQ